MKKNYLQKVLAVGMIGAMAAGTLSACGNSGSGNASSTPASTASTTESKAEASSQAATVRKQQRAVQPVSIAGKHLLTT